MPAPAAQIVLWTFTPPTDSWTGTFSDPGGANYSEITDTYDFHSVSVNAGDFYPYAYAWKQTDNLGPIHRIKFTFSLDTLPPAGSHISLLWWVHNPTLDANPNTWAAYYPFAVDSAGHIDQMHWGNASTNTISTGTAYDFELYLFVDLSISRIVSQVYIDDALWLSVTNWPYGTLPPPYVEMVAGLWNTYQAATDITLHMQDFVWTIENTICPGRWAMMALL